MLGLLGRWSLRQSLCPGGESFLIGQHGSPEAQAVGLLAVGGEGAQKEGVQGRQKSDMCLSQLPRPHVRLNQPHTHNTVLAGGLCLLPCFPGALLVILTHREDLG